MADKLSEIDGILHALGEMNAAWGHYEDAVFSLLDVVLGGLEHHASCALRNELDLKKAAAIIKSAAIIDGNFPAKEHVLQLVSWTDRPLREDRNRFVHDPLYSDGPGFSRHRYATTIKKPQAFKEPKVNVITSKRVTRDLLQSFTAAIRKAGDYSAAIQHHMYDDPDEPVPLSQIQAERDSLAALIASYTDLTKSLEDR